MYTTGTMYSMNVTLGGGFCCIYMHACDNVYIIAPDKAAYCVFTQFRGPENAIKLISVRTKTQ